MLRWLVFGVLPAVAAMLLGVGAGGPRWLAISLAVAVCVPFGILGAWPGWPWDLDILHGDSRSWLWWVLAGAGLLGTGYDMRVLWKPLMIAGEVTLVALLPWLMSAELRHHWSFEECVVWLGAGWLVIGVLWWALRATGKLLPGVGVPLAGTIALVADAWLLHEDSVGDAWQLAGVGAIALGIAVATTLWRRPFVCGTGGTLMITLLHVGLLWYDRSESELRSARMLLAMLVPLPVWIATTKPFADGRQLGLVIGIAGTVALAFTAIMW
jgi:hypothetical protein